MLCACSERIYKKTEKQKGLLFRKQSFFDQQIESLYALDLVALEAARADVTGLDLAVLHIGDLLHVRLERALGLAIGVAHVVPRRLTLSADSANSRHIFILPTGVFFEDSGGHKKSVLVTNVTMIAVFQEKCNEKRGVRKKIFTKFVKFFSRTLAN